MKLYFIELEKRRQKQDKKIEINFLCMFHGYEVNAFESLIYMTFLVKIIGIFCFEFSLIKL